MLLYSSNERPKGTTFSSFITMRLSFLGSLCCCMQSIFRDISTDYQRTPGAGSLRQKNQLAKDRRLRHDSLLDKQAYIFSTGLCCKCGGSSMRSIR